MNAMSAAVSINPHRRAPAAAAVAAAPVLAIAAQIPSAEIGQKAAANPFDNFALALKSKIEGLMLDRMERNEGIVTKYLNEQEFQDVAFKEIAKRIYDELKKAAP